MLLKAFRLLFQGYRLILSPMLHLWAGPSGGCRFEPSCSQYAEDAFEAHGWIRGSYLAVQRICRCNPFSQAGYDPVPRAIGKTCRNYY